MARDALLRVPLERDELRHVLAHAVLEGAHGEVEDLDRVPAAQRDEARSERLVIAAADANVRDAAVRGLEVDAQRMRMERRLAETRGHALGEEAVVVGAGHEVAPRSPDDAEALGNRREERTEVASTWPPELVGVRVDDPIRAEFRRRQARHPRHPLGLAQILARLTDQVQVPSCSYRSRISVVPSCERLSVATT